MLTQADNVGLVGSWESITSQNTVHTWMYIVLGGNETPAKVAIRPVYVAQKVKIKIIFYLNFVYTVHHITFYWPINMHHPM
jgi:hypothetical protein